MPIGYAPIIVNTDRSIAKLPILVLINWKTKIDGARHLADILGLENN
jgi:hypothetical protein